MVAEVGFDTFTDDAHFLSEGRGFELGHHLAFFEFTEVAALRFAGAVGVESGHLGEVFALLGDDLRAELLRDLFLRGELRGILDALGGNEDVSRFDLLLLLELFGMFFEVFLHLGFRGSGDVGSHFLIELADLRVGRDLLADAVEADAGGFGEVFKRVAFGDLSGDSFEGLFDFLGGDLHPFLVGGVVEEGLLNEFVHHHLLDLRLDHGALFGGHGFELATVAGGEKLAHIEDGDRGAVDFEDDVGLLGQGTVGRGGGSAGGAGSSRSCGGGRGLGGFRSGRGVLGRDRERHQAESENGGETGQEGGGVFHGINKRRTGESGRTCCCRGFRRIGANVAGFGAVNNRNLHANAGDWGLSRIGSAH